MKKNYIFYLLILALFINGTAFLWAEISGWLIKINGQRKISIENFVDQFNASIDFQKIIQPFFDENELEQTKKNKQLKKLFLKNMINDILIIEESKRKNFFNENQVNKKIRMISKLLKRGLIKQIYLQKMYLSNVNKIKPNSEITKNIYEKMKKDKRFKNYKTGQLYKLARKEAKYQEIQRSYIIDLDKLRAKNQIKTREEYLELLE